MAKKLTQAEIDELAKDSDEDEHPPEEQYAQDEFAGVDDQEEYPPDEQFEEDIQQPNEDYKIEEEPEVMSEIASENLDEVATEKMRSGSDFHFKKDEDLSEAQSEFIESSRLNDNVLKIKSNIKNPLKNNQDPKNNQKVNPKGKPASKPIDKPKTVEKEKPVVKKPVSKKAVGEEGEKKQKLSQSEIARRMKDIEEAKRQLLKKKEEKAKKQEEARRKEYQEAKLKEEERKEKNRRILEEQKRKKHPEPKPQLPPEEEIKIPQKRTDFKYMETKKERNKNQKLIQQRIQEENLQKLKKLNAPQPKEVKGDTKKAAILEQRNYQLQRQKKLKRQQEKQEDVLIIKQLKKEIANYTRQNLQKTQDINRAEKNIQDLKKKVKEKEKLLYEGEARTESKNQPIYEDLSELSPIQQFVNSFPQTKTIEEIYSLIDSNGDGVLSSAEINQKLSEFGLGKVAIERVEELLDENSDGTVTRQEFVFLVELEVKRQRDYRQILGEVSVANPIDLQAHILDMQAKLKYINAQMAAHLAANQQQTYQGKLNSLQRKADKLETRMKKQLLEGRQEVGKDVGANTLAHLTNEFIKLRNEKGIKLSFLEKLRRRVKENLAEKNKLLASRVEESLRLQEEVYRIRNEIQERELRFLSLRKIEQNKRGYLQRQTLQRREMEEAYQRTKQYEVLISDPTKKAQKNAQADQIRFLAAVLMIQRNYRKRKARREFQQLKAPKS